MHAQIAPWTQRLFIFICNWLLPLGFIALLMGLAALPDRSLYHKLFYALIAAPTLLALILHPRASKALWHEPVLIIFLMFSLWTLLSIYWSDTENSFGSLLKRPLYVLMLFAACALMALQPKQKLTTSTLLAALLMLPITGYSLVIFIAHWAPGARLIGSGALDNPLLSSHLFGFFCTLWLALSMTLPPRQSWLALGAALLMGIALLATGSRTPLVGTALVCAWLVVSCWNRRSLLLIAVGTGSLLALSQLSPELLTNRGLSYRPELWAQALDKIGQRPWLGYGFGANLDIYIAEVSTSFREPHSFAIGVLYYTGIIGLALWLAMYGFALYHCWKHRFNFLFIACGALLVYGLGAGLTEGGGILARPKEHWLITWIPLALIVALNLRTRHMQGAQH